MLAEEKENPQILLYVESKDGRKWGSQQIFLVHDGITGSVALDSQGIVHTAYSANGNTILYANTKTGLDKPMLIDMTKTQSPLGSNGPYKIYVDTLQLAIDNQENAHIVCYYSNSQIGYVVVSLDGTASTPVIIANDAIYPDIGMTSNEVPEVVYNNYQPFPTQSTQVWFIEKANRNWNTPRQISEGGTWAGAASIVVQPDDTVDVVYETGTTPDNIKLMYVSRDVNGVWSQPAIIGVDQFRPWVPSTGTTLSFGGRTAPSLSLLSNNRLAVVWRSSGVDATNVVGRIRDADGTWEPIQVLGQIGGNDYQDTQSIVMQSLPKSSILVLWPEDGIPVLHKWTP